MATKQQLREQILGKLNALPAGMRRKKSHTITHKICELPEYKKADVVFCYIALTSEADTTLLLERILYDGKTLAVPHLENNIMTPKQVMKVPELIPGPYDILQPEPDSPTINVTIIDLAIVPGLAFTREGVRLGRGGGYFDRWLPSLPANVTTIGLAFDFQIADQLPEEKHDVRVSKVVTETSS